MEDRDLRAHHSPGIGRATRHDDRIRGYTMNNIPALKIPSRTLALAFVLVILGTVASIYGVKTDPQRTWPHLLQNGFYLVSLGVSAAFFLATQRATGARWSAALRRIPEAFMMVLPVASILMTLLFFERQNLFPWSRPG